MLVFKAVFELFCPHPVILVPADILLINTAFVGATLSKSNSQHIGKYEVIKELGNGSVGVVYKALDPNLNRTVAIKMLKAISLGDKDQESLAHKRFYQEAQLAGMLRHPNIVTIFDAGVNDLGTPYIVMEYVEGKDLGDMIDERGALPPEEAINYLSPIASAIDYAHSQGIIHRDIKPSNIVISNKAIPYLLDFSVAKLHDTSITPTGTLLGTPEYMAPEQILGKNFDHRVDYFAFAVVLYEALTGQLPFFAPDLIGTATLIVKKPPRTFAEINCDLPQDVEQILNQALDKDPEQRFQGAELLIANLLAALKLPEPSRRKSFDPIPPTLLKQVNSSETPSKWNLETIRETTSDHDSRPERENKASINPYSESPEEETLEHSSSHFGQTLALVIGSLIFAFAGYFLLSFLYQPKPSNFAQITPQAQSSTEPQTPNTISTRSDSELQAFLHAPATSPFNLVDVVDEISKRPNIDLKREVLALYHHPDYNIKVRVLKLIVDTPNIAPKDQLVALAQLLLSDSEYIVRGFAVKALGAIGTKEAKELILRQQKLETHTLVNQVIRDELTRLGN